MLSQILYQYAEQIKRLLRATQICVGLMCIHQCPHELPFIQLVIYHFILINQQARVSMQNSLLYYIMTTVKALVISTYIARKRTS